MERLFKVIGILAVTAVIHKVHTPPASTISVSVKKSLPVNASDQFFRRTIPYFHILKAIAWAVAMVEITAIVLPSIFEGTAIASRTAEEEGDYIRHLRSTGFSKVSMFLILIGGAIRFWCYHLLQRLHTFQLCIVQGHKLITTGPYSIVRHPSYSTAYLIYPGMAFWYLAPGSVFVDAGGLDTVVGKLVFLVFLVYVLGTCGAFFGRIIEEDMMLKSAFGEEWDRWAESVPCVLFPGIY